MQEPDERPSRHPLRVLYVHGAGQFGGSSNSLRHLLAALPATEVESLVLCPRGSALEAFREAGIDVLPLSAVFQPLSLAAAPMRGLRWLLFLREIWNLRAAPAIVRAIRAYKPDLVHVNERVLLPALLARLCGVPVVAHARSVADRSRPRLLKLYVAALNRLTDEVIAIDQSVQHSLRELERCSIVYNPPSHVPAEVVRRAPAKDGRVRVTFASLLYPAKGVTNLLEAAKLLRSDARVVIRIAGSGNRPASFYRSLRGRLLCRLGFAADSVAEIQQAIEEFSLQNSLVMLGHVRDLPALYRDTDILVVPGRSNGPPRSVFEAGLYGVPSVVCLEDRIEDIVEDGVTGLIVPPDRPEALARALRDLAENEEWRSRLGRQARARFLKQFDGQRSALQVLSIYRRVLSAEDHSSRADGSSLQQGQ